VKIVCAADCGVDRWDKRDFDRAGGIAVRMEDPDNYYIARANALENNVRFYRVVAGKRQRLGTADIQVTSGEWHTLALEARGQRFAVAYDGAALFEPGHSASVRSDHSSHRSQLRLSRAFAISRMGS